jgi:succinate dehydrogenase/fumarate reductase flavoprotein subunit
MSNVSRRDLIKDAALGAAALSVGGAGAALAAESSSGDTSSEFDATHPAQQLTSTTGVAEEGESADPLAEAASFDKARYSYEYQGENAETVSPADAKDTEWDYETEVLCCGYGATGASAAIMAADAGAQVLIIDSDTLPGGSMARSGGGLAGAGTKVQEALGIQDSVDDFYNWVKTCIGNACPDDIVRVYCEKAADNIDWINELNNQYNGEDAFVAQYTDTYFNGISASGCDYELFGMSEEDAIPRSHWVWIGTGEDTEGVGYAGPELFDPLYEAILDRSDKITAMFQTTLQSLVQDADKQILGIVATDADGKQIKIKAKKGVILGTGGFPRGEDMQFDYYPDLLDYISFMNPNCKGGGIRAAIQAGAAVCNMTDFQPLYLAYPFFVGTKKDEYLYPMTYKEKWDDVFAMWDRPEGTHGQMAMYGAEFAETHGGVKINTDAEVLDNFGNVIPRLYASGADTGTNVYGAPGHYPGCGTYVGFALVFGRIAGTNAAALSNWDEQ